jgi:hypothetical protein
MVAVYARALDKVARPFCIFTVPPVAFSNPSLGSAKLMGHQEEKDPHDQGSHIVVDVPLINKLYTFERLLCAWSSNEWA